MSVFLFLLLFFQPLVIFSEQVNKKAPSLSIITSLYDGDVFIEGFLKDLTEQTIFSECELIIINANSPGNEETVIKKYMKEYPNIIYKKLEKDPGIYSCWNMAIKMASSGLITNANLDDRSKKDSYEQHVKFLEEHPNVDLVYAKYYITEYPNETFEKNQYRWVTTLREFSLKEAWRCFAGPRPVWRKSLHSRFGFFDDSFKFIGDWEMWIRAASRGAKYELLPGIYTLFYRNPQGLSVNKEPKKLNRRKIEARRVIKKYNYLWTEHKRLEGT